MVLAAACDARCDRRVVGQWEKLWRCRDSTEETTSWASEEGCYGEALAGRDYEGIGRIGPKWRVKP